MSFDVPRSLADLAELQRGVICRSQVLAAGLTAEQINWRIERGRWQRLQRGVYATFTGKADREAVLWAAVLRAGPGAALSYQTAGELDGLVDKPTSLIHVTIPARRRATVVKGAIIHSRLNAERATHPVRLPPRTRIEETVLDLTDECHDVVDAIDWIARALGRRLTTQNQLRAAASQRAQLRWRPDISEMLSQELAGIHSGLEFRYFRYVERPHGLPRSRRQSPGTHGRVRAYRDVLYDEYGVIIELDGKVAHPGDKRWQDIKRDNAAATTGVITLRYGFHDLAANPCLVAAQVAEVLQVRGWQGLPRRCSANCQLPAIEPRPLAS